MIRGVAASALRPLLTGPDRPGVVLAAGPRAAVLRIDDGAGWRCVCLLGPGTTRLPNGVHLPAPPDGLTPAGAPVTITAGILRSGPVAVRVVRWWDSRIPRVHWSAAGLDLLTSDAPLGVPGTAVARLAEAIGDDRAPLTAVADDLVGFGAGTTPGGDDVIAGTFAGLHAAGRPDLVDRLASALPANLDGRTTALSADLLRLARAGQACGEVLDVVLALHRAARHPDRPGLPEAVGRLRSVGHTSGADLTAGLVLGLRQAMT